MKGEKLMLLLPIGRLVQGSLYTSNDKDYSGNPFKAFKDGKPRVEYYIGVAIPKNGEQHWSHTEWGKSIYEFASKIYPGGQTALPDFAWKVEDGDSQIPKLSKDGKTLKKPCDKEGYPGNWIVHLKTSYAPTLLDDKGEVFKLPEGSINLGDFIHVYCSIVGNFSTTKPGLLFNQNLVAFIAYGKRITPPVSIDPKTIKFGGALPAGASLTPINSGFNPLPAQAAPIPAPIAAPPVAPYPNILKPKVMTAKANGATYEAFIQQGWTDETLIQHGYLQA